MNVKPFLQLPYELANISFLQDSSYGKFLNRKNIFSVDSYKGLKSILENNVNESIYGKFDCDFKSLKILKA